MDFEPRYQSPLGYRTGNNGIDSYGVNHKNFSLRDELEYQLARHEREQRLMDGYNARGINKNYPQFGTDFWGNPENNYGFGQSNVAQNIAQNQLKHTSGTPTTTNWQQTLYNQQLTDINKHNLGKIMADLYNIAYDIGERGYYYLQKKDLNFNKYDNLSSLGQAHTEAVRLTPIAIPDDNKHQYVSCVGAFDGPVTEIATGIAGALKEGKDLYRKWNKPKYGTNLQIIQDSLKDMKNNALGIYKGLSSSDINECNTLLPINAHKKFF